MKRYFMLVAVLAILVALVPFQPAEAGFTANFSLSCVGPNGVLSFDGEAAGNFDVHVNGNLVANYDAASSFQHTITGPGTWLVEAFFFADVNFVPQAFGKAAPQPEKASVEKVNRGQIVPAFSGTITCGGGAVVVEQDPCFPDGRINQNCAAPVAVYLVEDEDGVSLDIWRILPDTSGQPEMFFTPDELEGEGLRIVEVSGNIVLFQLESGEFQINVWTGLKIYVLRFSMPDGAVSFEGELELF